MPTSAWSRPFLFGTVLLFGIASIMASNGDGDSDDESDGDAEVAGQVEVSVRGPRNTAVTQECPTLDFSVSLDPGTLTGTTGRDTQQTELFEDQVGSSRVDPDNSSRWICTYGPMRIGDLRLGAWDVAVVSGQWAAECTVDLQVRQEFVHFDTQALGCGTGLDWP